MKRILRKFAMLFALMGIMLVSCEEPEPPVPKCERDGTGTVKIKNSTGSSLWVDCTYTSNGSNYEKKLSNGSSYTYTMDSGTIYIWGDKDGNDPWTRDSYYLQTCEDLTYTWYNDSKKSTGCSFYLVVHDAEGNLVKTIEEFEVVNKYE